jgi:DNA processing protein
MSSDETLYKIAVTRIPSIGPILTKKLIAHIGSPEAVFSEKVRNLQKIPGIGKMISSKMNRDHALTQAEKELAFMEKHHVHAHFFTDPDYPSLLKQCYDSPALLYSQGHCRMDDQKLIAIIGTRKITDYGKKLLRRFIEDIENINVIIVSGLAHGVDAEAHELALEFNLPTIGVLGHGLDTMYPAAHRNLAKKMTAVGALYTEYPSGTRADKEHFPMRNRIVAGMCHAVLVVESGISGGSMITAEYASNYNRDVFTFPGAVGSKYSSGCNHLIKTHKAALIESAADLLHAMDWSSTGKAAKKVSQLQAVHTEDELSILHLLRDNANVHIDELTHSLGWSLGKISTILLQLEIQGAVKSLPGKMYRSA